MPCGARSEPVSEKGGSAPPGSRGDLFKTAAGVTVTVALIALLAYGVLSSPTDESVDQALADGQARAAPGFELDVLSEGSLPPAVAGLAAAFRDGDVALDELRGYPLVLNFWASWCDPCREEAPTLERGWIRDAREGVVYMGLNMQDLSGDGRAFIEEFGVTYPSIRDPGREVADSYGLTGIPETFFIDASGQVVAHVVGVVSQQQLNAGVKAARRGNVLGRLAGGDSRPQR